MQEEGYVAKLLFPEGAKDVPLGKVVAILVENKDDIAKFKDFSGEGSSPAPAAPKQ
jgi:pyruvate dehydrogenase E2 component (dihydrolipoamide acetyltransferase)